MKPEELQYINQVGNALDTFVNAVKSEIATDIIASANNITNLIQENIKIPVTTFTSQNFVTALEISLSKSNAPILISVFSMLSKIFFATDKLTRSLKINIIELFKHASSQILLEQNVPIFACLLNIASEYNHNSHEIIELASFSELLLESLKKREITYYDVLYLYNVHTGLPYEPVDNPLTCNVMRLLFEVAFNSPPEIGRVALFTLANNTVLRMLGSTRILNACGLFDRFIEILPQLSGEYLDAVIFILSRFVHNEMFEDTNKKDVFSKAIPLDYFAQNIGNFEESCRLSLISLITELGRTRTLDILQTDIVSYLCDWYTNSPNYNVYQKSGLALCCMISNLEDPYTQFPNVFEVLKILIEKIADGSDEMVAYFVIKVAFKIKAKMSMNGLAQKYEDQADNIGLMEMIETYSVSGSDNLIDAIEFLNLNIDFYGLTEKLKEAKEERDRLALEIGEPLKYR